MQPREAGVTSGERAALRALLEKANPPGTWSARPRDPERAGWPAWCVDADSHDGACDTTVIPEIGSDNARAIAAAMNQAVPLLDALAAAESRADTAEAEPAAARDAVWCQQAAEAQRLIRDVADTDVLGLHPDGRRMLGNALAALAEVQEPGMAPPAVDTAGLAGRGGIGASLAAEVDWLRDQRAALGAGDAVAERDFLLLTMQRIASGEVPREDEEAAAVACGLLPSPGYDGARVIAAAVPAMLLAMRARGEAR